MASHVARQARNCVNSLRSSPSAPAALAASTSTPVTAPRRQRSTNVRINDALSALEWQQMRYQRCIKACSVAATEAPAAAGPTAVDAATLLTSVDIRIGRILKCERHPEADGLYVSQIECGEPEPRTIVSGLVKYVPIENMQDRKVVIIANLKSRNLKGIKSNGMVLCASDAAHENVEPLLPPVDAPVGERVWFGEGNQTQPAPAEPNRVQKKKIWEAVQPELKTSDARVAGFRSLPMLTSVGPVTTASLTGANIS